MKAIGQLGLSLTVKEESIALYSCNNEVPPKFEFSITINRDFSLSCYKSATYVPTRALVGGFSGKQKQSIGPLKAEIVTDIYVKL